MSESLKTFYKIESSEGFYYYCRPEEVQKMFDGFFDIKLDEIPDDEEDRFSLTITGVGMTEKRYQEYLEETRDA